MILSDKTRHELTMLDMAWIVRIFDSVYPGTSRANFERMFSAYAKFLWEHDSHDGSLHGDSSVKAAMASLFTHMRDHTKHLAKACEKHIGVFTDERCGILISMKQRLDELGIPLELCENTKKLLVLYRLRCSD